MSGPSLSPLQVRLLEALADLTPPWILTGGAALVGFYTGHRTTRDLDLRWSDRSELGDVSRAVRDRLRSNHLPFDVLQASPGFERLRVASAGEVVIVDLVADPVASIDEPNRLGLGDVRVVVDAPHDILVNKLCALLGRQELRDLQDVRELLATGGDLERALRDAPGKDGGFSSLTLAWVLQSLPAARLAEATGWSEDSAAAIERFRLSLIDRILASAAPD